MCQMPGGCIMHEQTGACPMCDEDGADRIAEYYSNMRMDILNDTPAAPGTDEADARGGK